MSNNKNPKMYVKAFDKNVIDSNPYIPKGRKF